MRKVLTEITPLSENDCFYLVDRRKEQFDYPIHVHREYELNLVFNCRGCQRVVGDSVETLDYYDLVLVADGLEHGWLQNGVKQEGEMREITIQWEPSTISRDLFEKTQFATIKELLKNARHGISFSQEAIEQIIPYFEELIAPQDPFFRFQKFWEIIYRLSVTTDSRTLSTSAFANITESENSRRARKVKEYISAHYADELRLDTLASIAGMSPTAFSRFFKTHTNSTLSDYIIDIRLGKAIRALIDTNMTVSEICYSCGFNNLSNFNRLFKKKKGCTPMEFREKYLKNKILV